MWHCKISNFGSNRIFDRPLQDTITQANNMGDRPKTNFRSTKSLPESKEMEIRTHLPSFSSGFTTFVAGPPTPLPRPQICRTRPNKGKAWLQDPSKARKKAFGDRVKESVLIRVLHTAPAAASAALLLSTDRNKEIFPVFPPQQPVAIRLLFAFKRPKSHFVRSDPSRSLLEKSVFAWPKRPDIDNLVKFVLDSLNGTLYHDDSQVVDISASKAYESLQGTTKEGTYISIRPVSPAMIVQAAALLVSSSSNSQIAI